MSVTFPRNNRIYNITLGRNQAFNLATDPRRLRQRLAGDERVHKFGVRYRVENLVELMVPENLMLHVLATQQAFGLERTDSVQVVLRVWINGRERPPFKSNYFRIPTTRSRTKIRKEMQEMINRYDEYYEEEDGEVTKV
jgi:hypothetical protein